MSDTWKAEYPGQVEPEWVWWDMGESEQGLLGFHTKEDRDSFSRRDPGPFRRRTSKDGKTIRQLETWKEFITRVIDESE